MLRLLFICTRNRMNSCHSVPTVGVFDKHSYLQELISSWQVTNYLRLPWLAWRLPTVGGKLTGGQYCTSTLSVDVVCYREVRNVCPVCGYRGSFSGKKRSGRDLDHSPPTSTDVKIEWSYTASLQNAFITWAGTTSLLKPKMSDQKAEKYCISAIVEVQNKELRSHTQT
jgi:hypothetical protein